MNFTTRIIRIFLPFVIGYFVTSYFRTIITVFAPFIESELGLSPTMMGLMTSLFFLSFALMQVPAGLLSDHYGPRRAQSSLFIVAGVGSILFGLSKGPILLVISRVMIGLGMAGGLMISFSANRLWFNEEELPLLNSLSFALGSVGAIGSAYPTHVLLEHFSWQTLSIVAGIVSIAVAIMMIIVLPDPKFHEERCIKRAFSGLRVIFSNRYYWKVTPLLAASMGVMLSMQSYWISPWLTKVNGADANTTSLFLLVIASLLIFSVPAASLLSMILPRSKMRMELVIGFGAICSIVSQILITLNIWPLSYVLWGLFAFFSFFSMLGYTSVALHFPSEYSGRSATAVNLAVYTLTFALQYLFGLIATQSYFLAFWFYIIVQICALIWFCIGKLGRVYG